MEPRLRFISIMATLALIVVLCLPAEFFTLLVIKTTSAIGEGVWTKSKA
jgi:hypothetical protein